MDFAEAQRQSKETLDRLRNNWTTYSKPPPKARTAYAIFARENYAWMRRKWIPVEGQSFNEYFAEQWNIMEPSTKKEFIDLSNEDKERYKASYAEWSSQFKGRFIPHIQRRRKNPAEPKRTRNPFIFYQYDALPNFRESHEDLEHGQLVALMTTNWRVMSAEEKVPYIKKCQTDKVRYRQEMRIYRYEQKRWRRDNVSVRKHKRLRALKEKSLIEKFGETSPQAEKDFLVVPTIIEKIENA